MSTWDDFEDEARYVEAATCEREPQIVGLLKDSIGLLADGFSAAEGSESADDVLAKMSLLSHSFGTLKCSADVALRGYYVQSMNLLRIVYENWVAYKYLDKNPDRAGLWLRPSAKNKLPKHALMLQEIDDDDFPLTGKMRCWYKTFCSFAHTDPINLVSQLSAVKHPGETSIRFGSTYDRDLFRTSAYAICTWIGLSILIAASWVSDNNPWHTQMAAVLQRVLGFIEQENEAFRSKAP